MIVIKFLYYFSAIMIFHTFIGYPISLYLINKIKKTNVKVNNNFKPTTSIIIPAHNEENVIINKLYNISKLNYPKNLFEVIIASDNSTDNTNSLVEKFISENKNIVVKLHIVSKRQGKTNAQNEAVCIAKGELLVFTDSNSMLDQDSISHLASSFVAQDIAYVTGRLQYINDTQYLSSESEKSYWNYDLFMRKLESNIKTITAGNGALYAVRKTDYVAFDPIRSHDSAMPLDSALKNKRALYNEKALAFEKAGETTEDEFKRKVRMFRGILNTIIKFPKKYNIFKYGWFSYFYFSHRTLRNSLFILHTILFITNLMLIKINPFYFYSFIGQSLFYCFALIGKSKISRMKIFYFPYYYSMTLLAQFLGAKNQITGKSKPFWEKAETTR